MNLELHDKLISSENVTSQFVDQCYKIVKSHLPHENAVSSSSKRRPAQLKVSTVYNYCPALQLCCGGNLDSLIGE